MYSIYSDGNLVYSSSTVNSGYAVTSPKLTLELNKAGSLSFKLPPTNPMYDKMNKLKSNIVVKQDDEEIFRGRVINDERDFYNRKSVYCEGELSFLQDSVVRPYSFNGGVTELFTKYLDNHNSQVGKDRQFQPGVVTVIDPNDYIVRESSDYPSSFNEMADKLVNLMGGYFRPRVENGVRYLDYVVNYGGKSDQTIEFGKNLLDITEYIDAEDVFTVLIPLGAEQKDGEGNATGRLTVADVNDGKDYIEDETAVSLFGRIWRTNKWDDVTINSNLLEKGKEFLKSNIEMSVSLTVKAADLRTLGVNVGSIKLGQSVKVVSVPHKLDQYFLCSKVVLYLDSPNKSEYTLGASRSSLTEHMVTNQGNLSNEISDTNDKISKESTFLLDAIARATSLITGSAGGYKLSEYDEDGLWLRDLYMDAPSKEQATRVMQINMNGIGFSNNGYDGPYLTAWTIDGKFLADWITAGTMSAQRIRGGDIRSNNYDEETGKGMKIDLDNGVIDTDRLNLAGYMEFNGNSEIAMKLGGWQIKKRTIDDDYYKGEAEYWDTLDTQENGLGAKGPWVVWGGWDGMDAYDPSHYSFVVMSDGTCKAMDWVTGSRAELKTDIQKYDLSGLDQVMATEVYRYKLKNENSKWRSANSARDRVGFVIGDGYGLSRDLIDGSGGNVDMYAAIGVAYKAIQELYEKVKRLGG